MWATDESHSLRSPLPTKPDGEPINDLSNGNKTDPKAKSTESTKARDEVQPSHFWHSLEFCNG